MTPSKLASHQTVVKNGKPRQATGKTIQRFANDGACPTGGLPFSASSATSTAPSNETGLPDHIKSGAEHHSGISLNDVRVHYNSPKPATMQAHAYTQGNQIHVAPGQERYLGHETWHAVQQKQNRVTPNRQLKGLNDSPVLEKEADVMGEKLGSFTPGIAARDQQPGNTSSDVNALQLKSMVRNTGQAFKHIRAILKSNKIVEKGKKTKYKYTWSLSDKQVDTTTVGKKMEAWLDPNHPLTGTEASANSSQENMMHSLKLEHNLSGPALIKGHLLNANLGGLADDNNLFPISAVANKEHEASVERKIKDMAWSPFRKAVGVGTYYSVDVKGKSDHTSTSNTFDCTWGDWEASKGDTGEVTNIKKASINSSFSSSAHPSKGQAQTAGAAIEPETNRKNVPGYSTKRTPKEGAVDTLRTNDTHKLYDETSDITNKSPTNSFIAKEKIKNYHGTL